MERGSKLWGYGELKVLGSSAPYNLSLLVTKIICYAPTVNKHLRGGGDIIIHQRKNI